MAFLGKSETYEDKARRKTGTRKELSRDLSFLEEQIAEQMYVWAASIGIDSEVLDEARLEHTTEDIMTWEQHEIYIGFDFTIVYVIPDCVESDDFRRMDEDVDIFVIKFFGVKTPLL